MCVLIGYKLICYARSTRQDFPEKRESDKEVCWVRRRCRAKYPCVRLIDIEFGFFCKTLGLCFCLPLFEVSCMIVQTSLD